MNQFHRPTEEKIEQLTVLFTARLLEKQNQFCKKLITKINRLITKINNQGEEKLVFFIFYQSKIISNLVSIS